MGPPGAGKGTLAKQLITLGMVHISTGDMFRDEIAKGTELGKLAESLINNGDLVPDNVTIAMLKNRLSQKDCENGFLLDGFPRTTAQAEALKDMSIEINRPIEAAIALYCDEKVLIERICGRRVCSKCGTPYHIEFHKPQVDGICDKCGAPLLKRKDDNEEALKVRLQHYTDETAPIINFYKEKGLLKEYDSFKFQGETLFDEVKKYLLS